MPLPRSVARFNRRITNRVLGPLAAWLPGFGVVSHRGRRSGREFRTPVNVFQRPGGVVIALTYGSHSDWVRNVLAADGCWLESRGRRLRLREPRLIHDETRRLVPPPLRPIGRLGHVSDFLDLSVADQTALAALPRWVRPFNALASRLLEAGMPMGPTALLTVSGRKTGLPRSTPVTVIEASSGRWLIGVYGEVDWVRNLRAGGRATVTRRGRVEQVVAVELAPDQSVAFFRDIFAPLVRRYGGLGAWIVRHVDKIDIGDPVGAAKGRPVFELRRAN